MYYLNSRYYNPEWGRFINADAVAGQVGELLGHNLFAYCKNNPVGWSDKTGFMREMADDGSTPGGMGFPGSLSIYEESSISTNYVSKVAEKANNTLYHYTNEGGLEGIRSSKSLNPSLKEVNPSDARYGNGQYLSDIVPGTKTPAQLSRQFINNPFQGQRYTHYIEIDVNGLNVVKGRDGVFVIPNEIPLNLIDRIISFGRVK